MTYTVRMDPAAERDFRRLSRTVQSRMRPRILALGDDPRPPGMEPLSGARSTYRIRIDDYRVIYEVHDDVLVVLVIVAGHRREVYERYRRRFR